MVGIIIYEVSTIICDIGIINVRFYLLEVRYPHGYRRITLYIYIYIYIYPSSYAQSPQATTKSTD